MRVVSLTLAYDGSVLVTGSYEPSFVILAAGAVLGTALILMMGRPPSAEELQRLDRPRG